MKYKCGIFIFFFKSVGKSVGFVICNDPKELIMKKLYVTAALFSVVPFILTACTAIGEKKASLSVIYTAVVILSMIHLLCYFLFIRKKDVWFPVLFISVTVVNIGYFTLSVSKNLEEALLANRISYLGSVFLPLSIMLIILDVCKIKYKKWLPYLLILISIFVFLVAASPGYLDIYYKEVYFSTSNGVSSLIKVYGPWHSLYLFFLLFYFAAMIITVLYAIVKKRADSPIYAVFLSFAVFINIAVWLLEQFVETSFELLSVSYVITEFFILLLSVVIHENEKLKAMITPSDENQDSHTEHLSDEKTANENDLSVSKVPITEETTELIEIYLSGIERLTPTEKTIFDYYIRGKTTKEIMAELEIKENTLKFHNKNLYGKLGVSSRKRLIEMYHLLSAENKI